ncbi:UNVERIFIED_CONTAM: protein unc-13 [Sesamum radiatum]|uniref:Protein unc-13 n=1 Tax=Sesamum radiatum TaxID=300843 RepID=A0AAW2MFI0_SESRA
MEFSNPLLRRYRSDRRKLLEFLMSSGLIGKITTPAGPITSFSNIDFDAISIDYVLEMFSPKRVNIDNFLMIQVDNLCRWFKLHRHLQSGDVFYLHSDPRSAGSPPHRVPPSIITHQREFVESRNSQWSNPAGERSPLSSKQVTAAPDINGLHNASILSVGLPTLKTGLLDDDMRESAYEVFLASMLFSGVEIHSTEGKKREKPSKFLAGLKNRRDKRQTERHIESESPERHFKISEAADTFIRRRLTQFATGKSCEPIDIPQLSLVLLTGVLRSDFPTFSSFRFLLAFLVNWSFDLTFTIKSIISGSLERRDLAKLKSECVKESVFKICSNTSADGQEIYLPIVAHEEAMTGLQANVFEELVSSDDRNTEKQLIGTSLGKIRNAPEWDIKMSPSQRSDVLLTLRQVALAFSSIPGRFGVEGETYYWTTGYHLNIRLYEKLLCGVFDILEDGQLIEEAQEILKLMKLTWSMLGITERLHHALFAWVLFKQFVATEEAVLLDYAICEVERVLSAGVYDDKEVAYLKSLTCGTIGNGCEIRLNLLQSIFSSITSWCDSKLQDYHLHFSQKSSFFERVLTMGLSAGVQDFVPHGNNQFAGSCLPNEMAREKIGKYVEKSLDAACTRVTELTTIGSVKDKMHPLAVLASELRLIAEKDLSLFAPILRSWYPRCAIVSAKTLHQFYGERLKPFLKDITCLTEDVRKVLPGAYALERCLIQLYSSACEENDSQYCQEFDHYPIAEISRSIILDWVVAQHDRILEWTGRAFDLEDWEPLSLQQKQAASAVEVFRIIEEVLNNICGLIDDTIRDLVVSNIWKASLEGFMWVLLDGGPSRAFSDTDITMIEEDFNMLKDLFVADGEGLPRSLVEEQAKFYHQILNLFSLKTESLIRMLMASSEHISVGVSSHKYGQRYLGDAQTLIRVLCHKKDREASMFLKTHYRLPSSSEYDDETAVEDSSFGSPLVSDIWKRSTSFRWSDKGHSSFRRATNLWVLTQQVKNCTARRSLGVGARAECLKQEACTEQFALALSQRLILFHLLVSKRTSS